MAYRFFLQKYIWINAYLIPCAHLCRYCCISTPHERHAAQFSFQRFHALVGRFTEWGKTSGFAVHSHAKSSDDITDKFGAYLDEKIGPAGSRTESATSKDATARVGTVRTGGARFRSDDGIRDWLARWRDAGSTLVHGSFAGYREVHDWWNNRPGDYDHLLRIQHIAAEMGLAINQTLFVMKNTIPSLANVVEDLEGLPKPRHRWAFPPAYTGRSRSRSAQRHRVTEEDRDSLFADPTIGPFIAAEDRKGWKSEREQIQAFKDGEEQVSGCELNLHVTDRNIDHLETTPCEEIVADLQARVEAVYATLPSREELMMRYGDPSGRKIYETQGDIERVWVDRFLEERRVSIERGLTPLL